LNRDFKMLNNFVQVNPVFGDRHRLCWMKARRDDMTIAPCSEAPKQATKAPMVRVTYAAGAGEPN